MSASRTLASGLLAASIAAHAGDELDPKMAIALQDRCQIAREADFAGDGRRRLEQYLESLVRASGTAYGIEPREFEILVSNAAPLIVGGRPLGGEIGCSWGKRYISLYKQVLGRKTLAETYNTIAREYFHHVQVRRDGVSCDSRLFGTTALDTEAKNWAQEVAPLCP